MNNKRLFYVAFTLVSVIFLICAASCGGTAPEVTSEVTTEEVTTAEPEPEKEPFILASGKTYCTVIRPIDADDDVVDVAKKLRSKLNDKLGTTKVEIGNDFVKPGTPHNTDKFEILVGRTAYDETVELLDGLHYQDFVVVLRGRKIVIAAANDDRLQKAVDKFLEFLGKNMKTEDNGDVTLLFDDFVFKAEYKVKDMKINGNPISEYKIVHNASGGLFSGAAETARDIIANATGYLLDIVSDTSAVGEKEIIVGKTSRYEVKSSLKNYSVVVDGDRLLIDAAGPTAASEAVRKLYADRLYAGGEVSLDPGFRIDGTISGDFEPQLKADGTDVRIISFNILTEKWGGTDTSPRCELLGILLDSYKPDALGVQETCAIWKRMIPYYCGSYKLICTTCPNGTENYSCIMYDSDRYDVEDSGVIPYSMTANVWCRNMGWALLKNKTTGLRFVLISTHWDFDNSENNRAQYRKVQAEEMSAAVANFAKKYDCPVFTTGDYNCIQSSDSMSYFRSINNMWCSKFDSKQYYNIYGSCSSLGADVNPSGNSIDFVFGTKDTECLGNMIIVNCSTKLISDHRPVLADIKINK